MSKKICRCHLIIARIPILIIPWRWFKIQIIHRINRFLCELLRVLTWPFDSFGLARGWYSAYDLLKSGQIEGRVILEDQGAPQAIENSIFLSSSLKQHRQQPWPIFWTHHKNARLIGSSLAEENQKKELCAEAAYSRKYYRDDPSYCYFLGFNRPLRLSGNWTSVISRWAPNSNPPAYGHWVLDVLPRLSMLDQFPPDTRILIQPYKLRYQTESLQLLGLLDRCRFTNEKHILIEDYYFSSPVSMIACYSPYSIDFLRSKFLPLSGNTGNTIKRFFVRRRGALRNIVNEEEVLSFFEEAGWAVIDTAEMSFVDQIKLFSGAEAICFIHGAAIVNAVWCSPGTKILELFAENYFAGGNLAWICQCVKAKYNYLIFPGDFNYNIKVGIGRLRKALVSLELI